MGGRVGGDCTLWAVTLGPHEAAPRLALDMLRNEHREANASQHLQGSYLSKVPRCPRQG